MKKFLRSWHTWVAVIVALTLGTSLLLAQVFDSAKLVETFNGDLYKEYKAHQVLSLDELAKDFQYQQSIWMPLAPPSTEFWGWTQEANPAPLPFDPADFPKDFVAGLIPSSRDGVVVYPVTAWEDPKTRDRVFYNADNKEIGSLPAPQGYDPRWCVFDMYPAMATLTAKTDKNTWLELVYDPSHLQIRYDLILDDDLIKWVLARSIRASLMAQQGTGGGVMMMKWQGGTGTVTNIQFVDIQKETNGAVSVTLAYPDQYRTNASTGFEIFTCDGGRGLLDSWWDLGVRTNVNTSTNFIVWADPGSTDSNVTPRFYAAALTNDADGDGFSDGFEKFVYQVLSGSLWVNEEDIGL